MDVARLLMQIADNDVYTGREVKRLLRVYAERDTTPYVKISAAVEITGMARSTLKAAAPRYWHMQQQGVSPPIRVRRTSTVKGAHWLFNETDCWAVRRANDGACAAQAPADGADDPLVAGYVARLTGNL